MSEGMLGGIFSRKESASVPLPERLTPKQVEEQAEAFAKASRDAYGYRKNTRVLYPHNYGPDGLLKGSENENIGATRRAMAAKAVLGEAVPSFRHFVAPFITKKNVKQYEQLLKDSPSLLRTAIESAVAPFANATNQDGTPDTSAEGEAAYEAGYTEPGPKEANRIYYMEVMARLSGRYEYELSVNEKDTYGDVTGAKEYREAVAGRVDAALEKLDLHEAIDIVLEELKVAGKKVPNAKALHALNRKALYARVSAAQAKEDPGNTYAAETLARGEMEVGRVDALTEQEKIFLRAVLVGTHATFEAAQVERAVHEGVRKRINAQEKENYQPFPSYLRTSYDAYIAKGLTPEEAALLLALDVEKDLAFAKKSAGIPEPWQFSDGSTPLSVEETSSKPALSPKKKKARASNAVMLGAVAALGAAAPSPITDPQFRYEQTQRVESEHAETGEGAYALVTDFIHEINEDATTKATFEQLFPVEGRSAPEYMRAVTAELGLFKEGTGESIVLQPGDHLVIEGQRITLNNDQNQEIFELSDAEGRKFPYNGELVEF